MKSFIKIQKAAIVVVVMLSLALIYAYAADDTDQAPDSAKIEGYEKPEICLKTNIRCILKQNGDTYYWCLKSSLQRTLDTRRTTQPIKKTRNELLGHCAKIIPIRE